MSMIKRCAVMVIIALLFLQTGSYAYYSKRIYRADGSEEYEVQSAISRSPKQAVVTLWLCREGEAAVLGSEKVCPFDNSDFEFNISLPNMEDYQYFMITVRDEFTNIPLTEDIIFRWEGLKAINEQNN